MSIQDLAARFVPTKVLKTDTQSKSIAILGEIGGEQAIVTLEKTAFQFPDDLCSARLADVVKDINLTQDNDIYFWALATLVQSLKSNPAAKLNLIYPATKKHIRKYAPQKKHMVRETPEIYRDVVKPYIETQKGSRIQWVYNILFEGKESETFIHHEADKEQGFVLLPDMKWDRLSMEALYLVAIVNRTDLSSVRDINGSHADYLETISTKIKSAASKKYSIEPDQFRLFVHYQPSYYHLHIHVVNIAHPGLGDGINVGKAILLDDIIENIKLMSDYYQKRTLYYQLGTNQELWEKMQESGCLGV